MSIAYIGIGSNVGDRQGYIEQAIDLINKRYTVLMQATTIETDPVGYDDQGKFLNTVISVDNPSGSSSQLLRFLQSIENQLGRERTIKNGPRTIDLDLLIADKAQLLAWDGLTVPHPRMHLRRFVLEPLCEIAPDLIHPKLGKSISELLRSLPD